MDQARHIAALQALLERGRDDAVLRFALGQALLDAEHPQDAIEQLQAALAHDAHYSAAWKLLGKARAASGDATGAADAYRQGIAVAEARGDIQAVKEMRVFLKRLG